MFYVALASSETLLWTGARGRIPGNSVIPVNGDETVDLENTQLYQKASRSSLS